MEERQFDLGNGLVCHTPDPDNYHDISGMRPATSGGSHAIAAASFRFGLKGVILPRATAWGGSRRKEIYNVGMVNIDPGYRGEKPIRLDISQLTEEDIENAMAETSESAQDLRDLAYKTFSKLANINQNRTYEGDQVSKPALTPVDLPNSYTVPRSNYGLEIHRRRASFSQRVSDDAVNEIASELDIKPIDTSLKTDVSPSVRFEGAKMMARNKQINPTLVSTCLPPQHRVTFELAGFGTIETSYHQVIQGDDGISLVLIYDNKFEGGTKYFPPVTDNELFVDVHNSDHFFKVKSAGLQYRIGDCEHHILLIEESVPKEA